VGTPPFLARIRKGDTVIQIMRTPDSRYIEEHARLIGTRKIKSQRGTAVTYLYLECRQRPKRTPWDDFEHSCLSAGLKIQPATRQLTNQAQVAKVLAIVSRRQDRKI
jgi:hypothetical protein